MNGLTAAELSVFLGVTAGSIRRIVAQHNIQPVATRWKAKLYDPATVLRHAGAHDRRTVCAVRSQRHTLTAGTSAP